MSRKYEWDDYGIWLIIFGGLTYVGASRDGVWGIFLAFNTVLTLLTTAACLMDWFRPVRFWLPRLLRWGTRCLTAFVPTAFIVYFAASDGRHENTTALSFALAAGGLAAALCLVGNVRAEVSPRRRRRP